MSGWIYIGKKRKKRPTDFYTFEEFESIKSLELRNALLEKYDEFCKYMISIGKPVTHIYNDHKGFIATDTEHTVALWDHLYSNWTGNNITDVIINDTIMRYNKFYNKYYE